VVLTPGTGKITVNDRGFEQYFPRETDRIMVLGPLKMTNLLNKFDVDVSAVGGGITGQAGALKMALSRALTMFDANTRSTLKKKLVSASRLPHERAQKAGAEGGT